jgi:ligand-binding sensor domain-containing protein
MDKPDNEKNGKVKGKKLIETLKLLGAISGFLALLGSALTFIMVNSISIYKQLTWEENIRVLKCNTVEGYLLCNTGDGEVYINDVTFYNDDTKNFDVFYIHQIINPKEFMENAYCLSSANVMVDVFKQA